MRTSVIIRLFFSLLISISIFGAAQPAQAANSFATGRYILVSVGAQRIYAYNNGQLVLSAPVNVRGIRSGTFRVQNKIAAAPSIYRGWTLPYWMGIYYVGRVQNGIHGPEMLRGGGYAYNSLGCVVIKSMDSAMRLYRWAGVGTTVIIQR